MGPLKDQQNNFISDELEMVNAINNNYFSTVFNKETDNNIPRSMKQFSYEDKLSLSSTCITEQLVVEKLEILKLIKVLVLMIFIHKFCLN